MTDEMDVKVVLLDIEGTVCPISFVKDVLFPHFLSVLPATLAEKWDDPELRPYFDAFPAEHRDTPARLEEYIRSLVASDIKLPALKALQGQLWLQGYNSGILRCPLFPDVAPTLTHWHASSIPILIYSSGSVAAQKLLFAHTTSSPSADLTPLLSGYFDTVTAGPKTESASYERIVRECGLREQVEKGKWLFLSDNTAEVRAAREAGMVARLVVREGNKVVAEEEMKELDVLRSFEEVRIKGVV